MLERRRRAFRQLYKLMVLLIFHRGDRHLMLRIQKRLIKEIVRVEKQIRRTKNRLRKLTLPDGTIPTSKTRKAAEIEERIEELRYLNYIWRSFGDAVLFIHLDKYALKQAYYKTHSAAPKQDAGFLSGKSGLKAEIAGVRQLLSQGVPAILCDVTNTVRFGDVCTMAGSDPRFVEVKSGSSRNTRARRQAADIKKLHDFFDNDVIDNLRGNPQVHRLEMGVDEVSHTEIMNECIAEARMTRGAVRNPEPGLYYAAMFDGADIEAIMTQMTASQGVAFQLNEVKSQRAWAPYYPFMLSIPRYEDLYDFVRGELVLFVLFDIESMRLKLEEHPNLKATLSKEDDYPIRYSLGDGSYQGGVSRHFLTRIGLEFLSPTTVVNYLRHSIETADPLLAKSVGSKGAPT